jgi:hypothetical protein
MAVYDESCKYCAGEGYCEFPYIFDRNPPTAQNDDCECVNGISQDCDEWDKNNSSMGTKA